MYFLYQPSPDQQGCCTSFTFQETTCTAGDETATLWCFPHSPTGLFATHRRVGWEGGTTGERLQQADAGECWGTGLDKSVADRALLMAGPPLSKAHPWKLKVWRMMFRHGFVSHLGNLWTIPCTIGNVCGHKSRQNGRRPNCDSWLGRH